MPQPIAYLNGSVVPLDQAKIAIFDGGIVLGATVSDMVRTFSGNPFRLEEHAERFQQSAHYAGLDCPLGTGDLRRIVEQLVEHNLGLLADGSELAIVFFLTPGELEMYAGANLENRPTICVHTFPLRFDSWKKLFDPGAQLVIPATRQVPAQCWSAKMKCRSRMHWWLANREAKRKHPDAIPLCLDLDGNLTETPSANLVLVQRGQLFTPGPGQVLPGVSLGMVRDLASKLGLRFCCRRLQPHDLVCCSEALLCSTPFSVAPVTKFEGSPIGSGKPGRVFKKIATAWSEQVGVDIVGQITGGAAR